MMPLFNCHYFVGKSGFWISRIRLPLHAAIVLCLSIHSSKLVAAATTNQVVNASQELARQCAMPTRNINCHLQQKTNASSLTSSRSALTNACWEETGVQFGIDPSLLKAIAWKESRGRPNAVGPKLKDGNVALGLMQINTIHLKNLARFGIERDHLFDACVSQRVGAWVLADCISKFGATWKAVGCYYTGPNSSNIAAQSEYVSDVQRFYAGYKKQEQQQRQRQQIQFARVN